MFLKNDNLEKRNPENLPRHKNYFLLPDKNYSVHDLFTYLIKEM